MINKRAFIIGTGPSLREIDVTKLKNEVTITFNRAYLAFNEWGFDPTYYLIIDGNDIRSIYKDVNSMIKNSKIKNFFLYKLTDNQLHEPSDFQDNEFKSNDEIYFESDKNYILKNIGYKNSPSLNDVQTDGNLLSTTFVNNAGFMGLKMLYYLGYREIYLLGMDARYTDDTNFRRVKIKGGQYTSEYDDDINHFRKDYFGKNITFGKPNQNEIINIWNDFMKNIEVEYPDLKIISCSKNSNLNTFIPYIDFQNVINL